jgi:hypothetical protein
VENVEEHVGEKDVEESVDVVRDVVDVVRDAGVQSAVEGVADVEDNDAVADGVAVGAEHSGAVEQGAEDVVG